MSAFKWERLIVIHLIVSHVIVTLMYVIVSNLIVYQIVLLRLDVISFWLKDVLILSEIKQLQLSITGERAKRKAYLK